ncbi:hypothetical protein D3C72_1799910 [compost metagenome]
MHGVRHQAHTLVRIETFYRFHQADIAFLNQVGMRQAIAQIAAGNRDHQAQVRQHQLLRGGQVIFFTQAFRQRNFFVVGQHGQAVHGRNIGVNIAQIASETEAQRITFGRNQCGRCGHHSHVFSLVVLLCSSWPRHATWSSCLFVFAYSVLHFAERGTIFIWRPWRFCLWYVPILALSA